MTQQSALEIKGSFLVHPFAELLAEIAEARLTGSLRVEEKGRKVIVYFTSGRLVFAVSNARTARLFEIMLRRGKLTKEDLSKIPNFSKDLEFAAYLEEKGFLKGLDRDRLFQEQIEGILIDVLSWEHGDWSFSSLARIRDGLEFRVDVPKLLVNFARCMAADKMLSRFRSMDETFERSDLALNGLQLDPDEAFVLSRASTDASLTATSIAALSSKPEAQALHLIYTLWLGGLLTRREWNTAFSDERIEAMRGARLELKREAKMTVVADPEKKSIEQGAAAPPKPVEHEINLTLDEYLARVEKAETHYDLLGIQPTASDAEIKRAYFAFARMFHPDKYHSWHEDVQGRVQNAFTILSQAHETLKDEKLRELYDFRMRKTLADREKRESEGVSAGSASLQSEHAAEHFEQGFNLLMDDEIEAAVPFLARAAHYSPKNAKYHAYYGKALSHDESKRHKAEAELQQAIKLDGNNPSFRILLAEFFIRYDLKKRAEGELNRLLAVFPSNQEAREMLADLQK